MKIRNGFISNSSSSSFILKKKNLTKEQIHKIHNHIEIAEQIAIEKGIEKGHYGYEFYGLFDTYDKWEIKELESIICCYVSMNNLELDSFIVNELGVNIDDIFEKSEYDDYSDGEIERIDNQITLEDTQTKINRIKSK